MIILFTVGILLRGFKAIGSVTVGEITVCCLHLVFPVLFTVFKDID